MKTTQPFYKNSVKLLILISSFIFLFAQLCSNSHALPLSWLNNIMISQSGLLLLLVDISLLIVVIKFKNKLQIKISLVNLINNCEKIAKNKIFLLVSCLFISVQFCILSANAGTTDTEFKDTVTWLTDHINGNMGLTVILADLAVGIFMVVIKKNYLALLGTVVLAVLIKFLPAILQSYMGFVL